MHDTKTTATALTGAVHRGPRAALAALAIAAAFALGACGAGASALPSVDLPTQDPNATPVTACVDAATKAVLDQLTASGADVPAILSSNEAVLIAGLQTFQPADEATETWRDDFVAALEDGDMTAAEAQVQELVSGGVAITAC